jgi:hypothetical protein
MTETLRESDAAAVIDSHKQAATMRRIAVARPSF